LYDEGRVVSDEVKRVCNEGVMS